MILMPHTLLISKQCFYQALFQPSESSFMGFGLYELSMKLHAPTASSTVRYTHLCPSSSRNFDLFSFFITSLPGFTKTSCNPLLSAVFLHSSSMLIPLVSMFPTAVISIITYCKVVWSEAFILSSSSSIHLVILSRK
ncbi:hypothetical protein V8G54_018026 [Vigna mungo]|uniref:Uncharacterized protein n=1 Tax=Vigna mungo TaxID=3915 RepID=A0AAQ3N797_VIGMU